MRHSTHYVSLKQHRNWSWSYISWSVFRYMQQREVYDRRMCQDKVVDGVKLAFTRGLKYRLQIVDVTDIEFVVSHHGDYIRKDHPILLKSNTDHIQSILEEHIRKHVPSTLRSSFVTYLLDGDVTTNEATHKGKQQQISTGRWKQHLARCSFSIEFDSVVLVYPQNTQVIYSYCCEILLYCNLFILVMYPSTCFWLHETFHQNMSSYSSHIKFISRNTDGWWCLFVIIIKPGNIGIQSDIIIIYKSLVIVNSKNNPAIIVYFSSMYPHRNHSDVDTHLSAQAL